MVGYTLLSNLAGKVLGTLLGNLPGTLNVKARARRSWPKLAEEVCYASGK